MSELKAISSGEIYNIIEYEGSCITDDLYYPKSEADKVIAELKDKLQNVSSLLNQTREWLVESQKLHKRCADNAVKVIRYNKYKRCLAMEMWCKSKSEIYNEFAADASEYMPSYEARFRNKAVLYQKWAMRWLELAENFKEAK